MVSINIHTSNILPPASESDDLLKVRKQRKNVKSGGLTGRIVELVSTEYPHTKEEASVLASRIWHLIEEEITSGLNRKSSMDDIRKRISFVSEQYDHAVEKLRCMNLPLLRFGVVTEYYRSL